MSSTTASATAVPRSAFTPLVRIVFVRAPIEKAFHRFTAEIGTWWPLASHSIGEANAETVTMETRVGGSIVERQKDGTTCTWGTLTVWDPPRRVAFTWHPGHDPAAAQDVDVRFEPADGGERTRVVLTHTGFERLGAKAKMARRAYPLGWTYVLGLYAERRGVVMGLLSGLTSIMSVISRMGRRRAD